MNANSKENFIPPYRLYGFFSMLCAVCTVQFTNIDGCAIKFSR